METDFDLVLSLSLNFAGQMLGDTMRQEIDEVGLMDVLVKYRVRKGEIYQKRKN